MSGKSTYLRQVALIVLLAQIGSFVPAESARIGAVDRIFTRVGASDRLARGESTFMVEMRETAEILTQASPRSLVILDEIGRGTSTFDGLSIAWAVAEYLHDTPALGARTLFATHYHELADLALLRERVRNAHFEVREWGDDVVFLRRLVPGEASRSYGIQVARLAGLPAPVIQRAREVLRALESGELRMREVAGGGAADPQLGLFEAAAPPAAADGAAASAAEREVLEALRAVDPERTAPDRRAAAAPAASRAARARERARERGGAPGCSPLALPALLGVGAAATASATSPACVTGPTRATRASSSRPRAACARRSSASPPTAPPDRPERLYRRSRRRLGRDALPRADPRRATGCCRPCASARTRSRRRAWCSTSSTTTATACSTSRGRRAW